MTRQYKPDYMESAIFDVLDELSTETLVYANQQHHELTPPYITLAVETRVTQGQDERWRVLDNGTQIYRGVRTGTITLLVIGDLCGERADDLINALKRENASAAFKKYGPVLHSAMPIKLGPIVTEGEQVEQAYAIDLQYRASVLHGEFAGWIEYVVVNYDIINSGGDHYLDRFVVRLGGGVQPVHKLALGELSTNIAGHISARPDLIKWPADGEYITATWHSSDETVGQVVTDPAHGVALHHPGEFDLTVTLDTAIGDVVGTRHYIVKAFEIDPLPAVLKAGTQIPRPVLNIGPLANGFVTATWSSSDYSKLDILTTPHALDLKAPGDVTLTVVLEMPDGTEWTDSVNLQISS